MFACFCADETVDSLHNLALFELFDCVVEGNLKHNFGEIGVIDFL